MYGNNFGFAVLCGLISILFANMLFAESEVDGCIALGEEKLQKAIEVLRFTNKRISKQVAKILRSAIANAEQKSENIDVDKLFVCNAYVNEGLRVGRFRAASMGRAHPYQRRQSHIVIAVAERGS